jgi:hypothetical protein
MRKDVRNPRQPTLFLSFLLAGVWSLTRRRSQAVILDHQGAPSVARTQFPQLLLTQMETQPNPIFRDHPPGRLALRSEQASVATAAQFLTPCGGCGRSVQTCMGLVSSSGSWAALLCRACAAAARRAAAPGAPPPRLLALRGRCAACPRRATFGPLPGRALHCKQHRRPGEEDAANRRCRAPGCPRQPAYGDPARGVPLFCAAHKAGNHTNLKRRLCQHPEVSPVPPCPPSRTPRSVGEGRIGSAPRGAVERRVPEPPDPASRGPAGQRAAARRSAGSALRARARRERERRAP